MLRSRSSRVNCGSPSDPCGASPAAAEVRSSRCRFSNCGRIARISRTSYCAVWNPRQKAREDHTSMIGSMLPLPDLTAMKIRMLSTAAAARGVQQARRCGIARQLCSDPTVFVGEPREFVPIPSFGREHAGGLEPRQVPRELFVDGLHGFPGAGAIAIGPQVEDHHRKHDQDGGGRPLPRSAMAQRSARRQCPQPSKDRHDELQEQCGTGCQFVDLGGHRLTEFRASPGRQVLPAGAGHGIVDFRSQTRSGSRCRVAHCIRPGHQLKAPRARISKRNRARTVSSVAGRPSRLRVSWKYLATPETSPNPAQAEEGEERHEQKQPDAFQQSVAMPISRDAVNRAGSCDRNLAEVVPEGSRPRTESDHGVDLRPPRCGGRTCGWRPATDAKR